MQDSGSWGPGLGTAAWAIHNSKILIFHIFFTETDFKRPKQFQLQHMWYLKHTLPQLSSSLVFSQDKKTTKKTLNSLIISCCIHSVIIPIFMLPEAMGETSKTFSYKIYFVVCNSSISIHIFPHYTYCLLQSNIKPQCRCATQFFEDLQVIQTWFRPVWCVVLVGGESPVSTTVVLTLFWRSAEHRWHPVTAVLSKFSLHVRMPWPIADKNCIWTWV